MRFSLPQKHPHIPTEVFQPVKLWLRQAMRLFHLVVVGGAAGRLERVLPTPTLVVPQCREHWPSGLLVSIPSTLTAVAGLHHSLLQPHPTSLQMHQQPFGK